MQKKKKKKIFIRNTRLGMTGKKHQTKLAHLMICLKSQLIEILVAVTRNKNFPNRL